MEHEDPTVAARVAHALDAHARGWALTPLNGKAPTTKRWNSAPPPTAETVRRWAESGNVGLRCGRVSGVVVLDVDPQRGGKPPEDLPPGPVVVTGSGGLHVYFAYPDDGAPVPQSKDRLAPGVEVKSDGGQVVFVGSTHPDTKRPYEWREGTGALPLPPLPADLLARIRAPAPGPAPAGTRAAPHVADENKVARARAYLAKVPPAVSGQHGHDQTFKAACSIVEGFDLDTETAYALLSEWNAGCEPPWSEKELRHKIKDADKKATRRGHLLDQEMPSKGRGPAGQSGTPGGDPDAPSPPWADSAGLCTDLANARRLVNHHGADLLYSRALGWLVWDGRRWKEDGTGAAMRRAKAAVRTIWSEARNARSVEDAEALGKWAAKSQGAERLRAVLALAETEPELVVTTDALDADPWLLNVANGTLDLRTGELRPHRREDLLTKLVPVAYDPDARAPQWSRFLEQVQPDPDVRGFLARYAGYCLTGTMGEQVFAIHHGGGENGKGVYSDTLIALLGLGEYAKVTPYDTFLVRRQGSATNDLAALRGARLVVAAEPNEGVRLDEAAVKGFTGEDPITCRFHYQEFFTYQPTGKLILSGNHRPRIRGTDHAMWRRVRLVPWPVTFSKEKRDNSLRRKLKDELPGVLAWAVRGCLEWQCEGLRPPEVVLAAVEEYRESEDHVGRFIADRCRLGASLVVTSKELRAAYTTWAEDEGEEALSAKAFGAKLTDRGLRAVKDCAGIRGRGWKGVGLATHSSDTTHERGSPPTRAREGDFTYQSAQVSQAAQSDPDDPVEAAEREAVREEACGSLWPRCPICGRDDRREGSAAGCRVCREYLDATGGGRERGVL
ncbi:MAG: phage/plasmid primase, P4 family [Planctomycetota bacterium]